MAAGQDASTVLLSRNKHITKIKPMDRRAALLRRARGRVTGGVRRAPYINFKLATLRHQLPIIRSCRQDPQGIRVQTQRGERARLGVSVRPFPACFSPFQEL